MNWRYGILSLVAALTAAMTWAAGGASPAEKLAARLHLSPASAAALTATTKTVTAGTLHVEVLQGRDPSGNRCYAWAGAYRGRALSAEVNPGALSAGAGFYFPVAQPDRTHIVLVQRDGSGGKVHVALPTGEVVSLPGRDFLVTPDESVLVAFTSSATGAIAFFSLRDDQVIFQNERLDPGVHSWYAQGDRLVGSVYLPVPGSTLESPQYYYLVDYIKGAFRLMPDEFLKLKDLRPLKGAAVAATGPCRCPP